jgi:peptide/nickel transport system permease protein
MLLGGVVLSALAVLLVAPDRVAPQDPAEQTIGARLAPPLAPAGPGDPSGPRGSTRFLLGSDHLGRDVLSRLVYGARVSLLMGLAAVALSLGFGVTAGVVAGYFGGALERAIMRLVDVQMAFPFILLALAVVGVLGPSPVKVVLVIGIGGWVQFARVIRSEILSLREREFIEGARATGAREGWIVLRHVLPNVAPSVVVLGASALAYAIVAESSLSFLGVGVPPSTPSWGAMLADGRQYVDTAWWLATFPGLAILLAALGANALADRLRDSWDPVGRAMPAREEAS